MGYRCDNHPDQAAVLLITNLGNGDTMTPCIACAPDLCAALTDTLTAVRANLEGEAPDPATGDPTHDDDAAADPAAAPAPASTPAPAPATPAPAPESTPDEGDDYDETAHDTDPDPRARVDQSRTSA